MLTIKLLTPALAAFAFAAVSIPATADASGQVCGEREDFVQKLNKAYGERPSSAGLESEGSVFEVFRSDEGSWTILSTQPTGLSCIVAVGDSCIVAVGDAWFEGDWAPGEQSDDVAL